MKTKRTVFEVNDVYRVMENSELIYTLTNSESPNSSVKSVSHAAG